MKQTKQKLTFLSIDVIQKVDGVFNNTVTHIAVVPENRQQEFILSTSRWVGKNMNTFILSYETVFTYSYSTHSHAHTHSPSLSKNGNNQVS